MRVRRSRIPTALEDGGTGSRTREEAVAALGVPSLTADNTFTGANEFTGTLNARLISHPSDLTLGSVDGVRIGQDGGSGFYCLLEPSALTASHYAVLPDKDGTLAMLSDITGGSGLSQAQTFARISMGF
jgi:hypothetical protein